MARVCARGSRSARSRIRNSASAALAAALAPTLGPARAAHAQAQPSDCNSSSVGASLVAMVNGQGLPPGQCVIPGQEIQFLAGVFVSPDPPPPSTINFCDIVGGQLSVTLPNWMAVRHGPTIPVAGYAGTPAMPQFGNTSGPVLLPVPVAYLVDADDVGLNGFLNARLDYGPSSFLFTQGISQQPGIVLSNPPQEGSANVSVSIPFCMPVVKIKMVADNPCEGEPSDVTFTMFVENDSDVDFTMVDVNHSLCSPRLISGDDGDGTLNVGETWVYTCMTELDATTRASAWVSAFPIAFNGDLIDTVKYMDRSTLVVQAKPQPLLSAQPSMASLCEGQSQAFCAFASGGTPPYRIDWFGPGGALFNTCNNLGNGGSCCLSASEAGQYCATVTDANGCTSMQCVTLEVNEPPAVTVNPPADVLCAGASQQICGTPIGQGPFTFMWSGPGGFSAATPCVTVSQPGAYCLLVIDGNGCASVPACAMLTAGATPTASVNPPSAKVCDGLSQTLTAQPAGGVPPYTFAWTGPGGFGATTPSIVVSVSGQYCVTITDANGCAAAPACATLAIGGGFECAIDGPAAVCGDTAVEYCAPKGLASYDWSVTGGAKIISQKGHCIVVAPRGGSFTVSVQGSDVAGCACEADLTVSTSGPTLALDIAQGECLGPAGGQVLVELHLRDVASAGVPLIGYQAFVAYDPAKFTFLMGAYTPQPFGMPVMPILPIAPGVIGLAAGVAPGQPPASADAKLATMLFVPTSTGCEGLNFTFGSAPTQASLLSGAGGVPVQPCLADSPGVVIDGQPPRIVSCCEAVVLEANGNCQNLIPDLTRCAGLEIVDNCGGGELTITQFPPAGTIIGKGTIIVTILVSDCAGNTAMCQVPVTVRDVTPPDVTCPGDRTLKADNACTSRVPDLRPQVSGDDNCDNPSLLTITQNPPPNTVIGLGEHVVIISVSDNDGNKTECEVTLTVIDARPPVLLCPHDRTLVADKSCMAPAPDLRHPTIIVDNCTPRPLLDIVQTPAPGTPLGLGEHKIEISATDKAGNSASCTLTVDVVDDAPPTITCPGPVSVQVNGNCQSLVPDVREGVIAKDSCGEVEITQDPPPGHIVVGLGPFAIVVTATDEGGLSASCEVDVIITDRIPPTIVTCSPTLTIPADDNCEGVVPQMTGGVVARDNCTPAGELEIEQSPAPGTPIAHLGRVAITITVRDESGNQATCTTMVVVVDDTAPVLDCPENIVAECTGDKQATVAFDVDAVDNCDDNPAINCFRLDGSGAPVGIVNPTGTKFPKGRTIVLCQGRDDANNFSFCLFSVTVVDTTPPDLTCPSDRTVNANGDCDFIVPNLLGDAIASDVCSGDEVELTQNPPAGSRLKGLGQWLVTITAGDKMNNTTTCKVTITVVDNSAPEILLCPGALTMKADERCQAQVPDFRGGVVAVDNCTPMPSLVIEQSPAPSTHVGIGTTPITITVTDASGHNTSCVFNLVVSDQMPPVIWACGGGSQALVNGSCLAKVPDMTGGLVATDACPGRLSVVQDPAAGESIGPGTHAVTITVTDDAGNSEDCSLPLVVRDAEAPQITCGGPVEADATFDVCSAEVDVEPASAQDNCTDEDDLKVTGTRSDGKALDAAYPVGDTTITWRATDEAGNTSSCTQLVRVLDVSSPTLTCPANANVDADAGTCSAQVNPGQATARDSCDTNVAVSGVRNDGHDLDDPYPTGTTLIVWTATDDAGNVRTCTQQVKVSNDNRLVVDIDLNFPVAAGTLERCITFELFDCGVKIETVEKEIEFVNGRARNQVIDIPCGTVWDCITAQDPLHTLRRRDSTITIAFNRFEAQFTGTKGLIGGDLNDDGAVSVLDIAVFNSRFGVVYDGGDTACGDFDPHGNPHADINGDGVANFSDHAIIAAAMFNKDEQNCCGMAGVAGGDGGDGGGHAVHAGLPVPTSVHVPELRVGGSGSMTRRLSGGDMRLDVSGSVVVGMGAGAKGAASLTIASGASLSSRDGAIGGLDGSAGDVIVDGGTWTIHSALDVGFGGPGTLTVLGGGIVAAGEIRIGPSGVVRGDGTLHADVLNSGLVEPAPAIDGSYEQRSDGTLVVEIGAAGEGALFVSGEARLGGTLSVTLPAGGLQLADGEAIEVLRASRITGTFDALDLIGGDGAVYTVEYQADRVLLTLRRGTSRAE